MHPSFVAAHKSQDLRSLAEAGGYAVGSGEVMISTWKSAGCFNRRAGSRECDRSVVPSSYVTLRNIVDENTDSADC